MGCDETYVLGRAHERADTSRETLSTQRLIDASFAGGSLNSFNSGGSVVLRLRGWKRCSERRKEDGGDDGG